MIQELRGRAAVVTGAAGGIGFETAGKFATEGMRVMLADIAADRLDAAVRQLRSRGATAYGFPVDVSSADEVEALAAAAESALGSVDVLVNNAGIVNVGSAWELPLAEWHRVIGVDLWGVIHGVLAFVPRMLRSATPAHIVNVGSMASVIPHPGLGPYVTAKHAVLGFSDSLRGDLAAAGAPIGVTVVMPGRVRTGMTPDGVPPRVVANAIVEAIRNDAPHVFTEPQRVNDAAERFDALLRRPR
jgi:NAD(P)-dependent dehydrogenase (short-subunit alcohol dehydrogenase family)